MDGGFLASIKVNNTQHDELNILVLLLYYNIGAERLSSNSPGQYVCLKLRWIIYQ